MTSNCATGSLHWDDELGYGFDCTPVITYSGAYFVKYQQLDNTPMGLELTRARVKMVHDFYGGDDVIDIGIGGGRFCIDYGAWGYDVSEEAVYWLQTNGMYADPYLQGAEVLTFWDALEHIPDPAAIVKQASKWVFVSMPVYHSKEHCLSSKHYKPGEHVHYWTDAGLIKWFTKQGFVCMGCNNAETRLGREGIMSYAFQRI